MSDFQAIADRVEIEALRSEFTDAAMMRVRARLASLFTPDGPCGSKTTTRLLGGVDRQVVAPDVGRRYDAHRQVPRRPVSPSHLGSLSQGVRREERLVQPQLGRV